MHKIMKKWRNVSETLCNVIDGSESIIVYTLQNIKDRPDEIRIESTHLVWTALIHSSWSHHFVFSTPQLYICMVVSVLLRSAFWKP